MTRQNQRAHQEALELARAAKAIGDAVVATKREPRHRFIITTAVAVVTILVFLFVGLYVAHPSVEPVDAFVRCPICDRGGPFLAPPNVVSANTGAVFSVKLQNTGGIDTTLLSHNLSFRTLLPGESWTELSSKEETCPGDDAPVSMGSHSTVTLSIARGETIVAVMRKIVPAPEESD